jgi:TonB family protein
MFPSPAWADPPLSPVKPWVLDYGETQCTAARDYGNAANPTTFVIRPAPNGETFELLVGRQRRGPTFAEELEGSVDFGLGPIKAWLLHYGSKTRSVAIHQFRIPAAEMVKARAASVVTLHIKGGPDVSLSLANMSALLSGLQECTADLKRYWNMNAPEGTIAKRAKGSLRGIFTDSDYPAEALGRSQEGRAQFLLLIDKTGKVAACHVYKASGVPALDAMGCQAIRERAKFTPALDVHGIPIRDTVVTPPVTWRLY